MECDGVSEFDFFSACQKQATFLPKLKSNAIYVHKLNLLGALKLAKLTLALQFIVCSNY